MPPPMRPRQPLLRDEMWIAISVEFGPGIRLVAAHKSTNCCSVSHCFLSTNSRCIIATCAAGPPNATQPSTKKYDTTSRRRDSCFTQSPSGILRNSKSLDQTLDG